MGLLSKVKSIGAKVLDYISAPLSQPLTFISKGPTAAAQKVQESRKQIASGDKKQAAKVIGTTLTTTAVVAGTVLAASGAAAGKAGLLAQHALKRAAAVPGVKKVAATAGVLAVAAPQTFKAVTSSPAATKTVIAGAVNPLAGIAVGLEQGSGLLKTAVETNKDTLKTVATVAGGAALLGGAVVIGSKIKDKLDDKPINPETGLIGEKEQDLSLKKPIVQETQIIEPTREKKPSTKPRRARQQANRISQRVNVSVNAGNRKVYKGIVIN